MAIQGQCEWCENDYPEAQLIAIVAVDKQLCPNCINDYINDVKYDRDRYKKCLDNIKMSVTEYLNF